MSDQKKQSTSKPEVKAEGTSERRPFYVVGPGAIRLGGETHLAGAEVMLTKEELAGLGALVSSSKPKPPAAPREKRGGGIYRVLGPGSVKSGGQFHRPGSEIYLEAADARQLDVALELVEPG